jgi:hypothetical protein
MKCVLNIIKKDFFNKCYNVSCQKASEGICTMKDCALQRMFEEYLKFQKQVPKQEKKH